jgi:DUF1016 N-terminal domain
MGLSPRNLWDMKKFYEYYQFTDSKVRQAVALLPWGHNLLIMSKSNSEEEALFYASKTIELAWSRDILLNYIKANTYLNEKGSTKSHNFLETLPENMGDYAHRQLEWLNINYYCQKAS